MAQVITDDAKLLNATVTQIRNQYILNCFYSRAALCELYGVNENEQSGSSDESIDGYSQLTQIGGEESAAPSLDGGLDITFFEDDGQGGFLCPMCGEVTEFSDKTMIPEGEGDICLTDICIADALREHLTEILAMINE